MPTVPLTQQQHSLLHNKEVFRCYTCTYHPPTHMWPVYACTLLHTLAVFVLLLYVVVILFRSRIIDCETGVKPSSPFDSVGWMTENIVSLLLCVLSVWEFLANVVRQVIFGRLFAVVLWSMQGATGH